MWTLFKLVRWLVTGLAALWVFSRVADGGLEFAFIYGQFIAWPLALLWILPAIFRHRPPKAKAHDPAAFKADVSHDNIALDFARDRLWIRDPKRGERYLERSQVLNICTNREVVGAHAKQRLEFQVRDLAQPQWNVLFQRYSTRWRSSDRRNAEERDEWFARIRA